MFSFLIISECSDISTSLEWNNAQFYWQLVRFFFLLPLRWTNSVNKTLAKMKILINECTFSKWSVKQVSKQVNKNGCCRKEKKEENYENWQSTSPKAIWFFFRSWIRCSVFLFFRVAWCYFTTRCKTSYLRVQFNPRIDEMKLNLVFPYTRSLPRTLSAFSSQGEMWKSALSKQ